MARGERKERAAKLFPMFKRDALTVNLTQDLAERIVSNMSIKKLRTTTEKKRSSSIYNFQGKKKVTK